MSMNVVATIRPTIIMKRIGKINLELLGTISAKMYYFLNKMRFILPPNPMVKTLIIMKYRESKNVHCSR